MKIDDKLSKNLVEYENARLNELSNKVPGTTAIDLVSCECSMLKTVITVVQHDFKDREEMADYVIENMLFGENSIDIDNEALIELLKKHNIMLLGKNEED